MSTTAQTIVIVTCVAFWGHLFIEASVNCPSTWLASKESGTCIKLYLDEKDWYDARASCQSDGGDLVKIINEEMNDFIVEQYGCTQFVWIGLSDIADQNVYVWLDEDTEPAWTSWSSNQPERNPGEQQCAYMEMYTDEWSVQVCSSKIYQYICEAAPSSTSAPGPAYEVLCPVHWIPSPESGTCIRTYGYETWDDARTACQARGGDLVKIVNYAMNYLVAYQGYCYTVYDYWIGVNNKGDVDIFAWLDEGVEAEFTNWANDMTDVTWVECGVILDDTEFWDTDSCDETKEYTCEMPGTLVWLTTALPLTDSPTPGLNMEETTKDLQSSVAETTKDHQPGDDILPGASSTSGLSGSAVAVIIIACLIVVTVPAAYFGTKLYARRRDEAARHTDIIAFSFNDMR